MTFTCTYDIGLQPVGTIAISRVIDTAFQECNWTDQLIKTGKDGQTGFLSL